jgi:hypothetical protein
MVDACIGGETAVNVGQVENVIGTSTRRICRRDHRPSLSYRVLAKDSS